MSKQQLLPGIQPVAKLRNRLMKVQDAGPDLMFRFVCPKCDFETSWIQLERESEHRNIPCPFCSPKSGFIPLRSTYWEQFRDGEKSVEYRPNVPRWSSQHWWTGRPVRLSKGYSGPQIGAIVTGHVIDNAPAALPGFADCYGSEVFESAVIIELCVLGER